MNIAAVLDRLLAKEDLSASEVEALFTAIMQGQMPPEQIAALLMALRAKGESISEIVGAARAMRQAATKVELPVQAIDMCGTGGDGKHTLNISTAASLVVAAAGVPVAKHGNRSVSSKSGSADVLEALGVPINLDAIAVGQALVKQGFAFLFAPNFHPAMKHAGPVRRSLGVRTIFNLLGPLTNPAAVRRQVLGVFAKAWVEPLAHVLAELGSERAMVLHSQDGLDELSLAAPTWIAEWTKNRVTTYEFDPTSLGLKPAPLSSISGGDAVANAAILKAVLAGEHPQIADWVAFNAAAGLRVALDLKWPEALAQARAVLRSGAAANLLTQLQIAKT